MYLQKCYENFKKYAVSAESVEDFCNKYHNRAAFHDRGAEYMEADIEAHKKEFEKCGFTIIPKGSSTTGDNVTYYGTDIQEAKL